MLAAPRVHAEMEGTAAPVQPADAECGQGRRWPMAASRVGHAAARTGNIIDSTVPIPSAPCTFLTPTRTYCVQLPFPHARARTKQHRMRARTGTLSHERAGLFREYSIGR